MGQVKVELSFSQKNKSLENIKKDLLALKKDANISVIAETKTAKEKLKELSKEILGIKKNTSTTFKVATSEARNKLSVVENSLKRIKNNSSSTIKIKTTQANKNIDTVYRNLNKIHSQSSGKIDLNTKIANNRIKVIQDKLTNIRENSNLKLSLNTDGAKNDLKKITNETKTVNKDFKESGKSINNLNSGLTKTLSLVGFIRGVVGDIKDLAKLDQAFYDLGVVAKKSVSQIEEMKREFLSISSTIPQSAVELAEGVNQIARTGRSYEDALKIVRAGAKLSTASGENLSGTLSILNKALVAFELSGDSATKAMDSFHSAVLQTPLTLQGLGESLRNSASSFNAFIGLSGKAGESLTQYKEKMLDLNVALTGGFVKLGRTASQSGTKIRTLLSKMVSMEKTAMTKFNALNLSMANGSKLTADNFSQLAQRDLPQALNLLSKLYTKGKISTEVMKSIFTMRHFLDISSVLTQINGDVENFIQQNAKGAKVQDDYNKQMFNFNNQLKILKGNFQDTKTFLYDGLKALATPVMVVLNGIMDISKAISNLGAKWLMQTIALMTGLSVLTTGITNFTAILSKIPFIAKEGSVALSFLTNINPYLRVAKIIIGIGASLFFWLKQQKDKNDKIINQEKEKIKKLKEQEEILKNIQSDIGTYDKLLKEQNIIKDINSEWQKQVDILDLLNEKSDSYKNKMKVLQDLVKPKGNFSSKIDIADKFKKLAYANQDVSALQKRYDTAKNTYGSYSQAVSKINPNNLDMEYERQYYYSLLIKESDAYKEVLDLEKKLFGAKKNKVAIETEYNNLLKHDKKLLAEWLDNIETSNKTLSNMNKSEKLSNVLLQIKAGKIKDINTAFNLIKKNSTSLAEVLDNDIKKAFQGISEEQKLNVINSSAFLTTITKIGQNNQIIAFAKDNINKLTKENKTATKEQLEINNATILSLEKIIKATEENSKLAIDGLKTKIEEGKATVFLISSYEKQLSLYNNFVEKEKEWNFQRSLRNKSEIEIANIQIEKYKNSEKEYNKTKQAFTTYEKYIELLKKEGSITQNEKGKWVAKNKNVQQYYEALVKNLNLSKEQLEILQKQVNTYDDAVKKKKELLTVGKIDYKGFVKTEEQYKYNKLSPLEKANYDIDKYSNAPNALKESKRRWLDASVNLADLKGSGKIWQDEKKVWHAKDEQSKKELDNTLKILNVEKEKIATLYEELGLLEEAKKVRKEILDQEDAKKTQKVKDKISGILGFGNSLLTGKIDFNVDTEKAKSTLAGLTRGKASEISFKDKVNLGAGTLQAFSSTYSTIYQKQAENINNEISMLEFRKSIVKDEEELNKINDEILKKKLQAIDLQTKQQQVQSILGATAQGAQAGASFGPLGTAVGAGIGLVAGLFGANKAKEQAEIQKQQLREQERIRKENERIRKAVERTNDFLEYSKGYSFEYAKKQIYSGKIASAKNNVTKAQSSVDIIQEDIDKNKAIMDKYQSYYDSLTDSFLHSKKYHYQREHDKKYKAYTHARYNIVLDNEDLEKAKNTLKTAQETLTNLNNEYIESLKKSKLAYFGWELKEVKDANGNILKTEMDFLKKAQEIRANINKDALNKTVTTGKNIRTQVFESISNIYNMENTKLDYYTNKIKSSMKKLAGMESIFSLHVVRKPGKNTFLRITDEAKTELDNILETTEKIDLEQKSINERNMQFLNLIIDEGGKLSDFKDYLGDFGKGLYEGISNALSITNFKDRFNSLGKYFSDIFSEKFKENFINNKFSKQITGITQQMNDMLFSSSNISIQNIRDITSQINKLTAQSEVASLKMQAQLDMLNIDSDIDYVNQSQQIKYDVGSTKDNVYNYYNNVSIDVGGLVNDRDTLREFARELIPVLKEENVNFAF